MVTKTKKRKIIREIQGSETIEDALAAYLEEEYITDNAERDILIGFIEDVVSKRR